MSLKCVGGLCRNEMKNNSVGVSLQYIYAFLPPDSFIQSDVIRILTNGILQRQIKGKRNFPETKTASLPQHHFRNYY